MLESSSAVTNQRIPFVRWFSPIRFRFRSSISVAATEGCVTRRLGLQQPRPNDRRRALIGQQGYYQIPGIRR
jgi:hypothetical protein